MTLPWYVPAGALALLLAGGAGWFYQSGKAAEERAQLRQKIAADDSIIVVLHADSVAAGKKRRADSTLHATDSGNYTGLEVRLRAAEARYIASQTASPVPVSGSPAVVVEAPVTPPSPGLIDSTLNAADAAQKSCSLLVQDCEAQKAILRQELAATQDERDVYKRQTPTFLMRNEVSVCTATGVMGLVAGVIAGKHL